MLIFDKFQMKGALKMATEWIWCPYCHKGESCENKGGNVIVCPSTGKTFTIEQSCADIKNR